MLITEFVVRGRLLVNWGWSSQCSGRNELLTEEKQVTKIGDKKVEKVKIRFSELWYEWNQRNGQLLGELLSLWMVVPFSLFLLNLFI